MKPPSFPFYPNNWFGSSRIACMEAAQEGAYIRLLAHQWNSQDQTIPADEEKLAMMSKLGMNWMALGRAVLACFDEVPGEPDKLRNERLYHEYLKIQRYRDRQSQGGKTAMAHRWASNKKLTKSVISHLQDTNNIELELESESREGSIHRQTLPEETPAAGSSGFSIDYSTAKIPEINGYDDIHGGHDPILVAIAITGEREKQGWGYWVKVLREARAELGKERADRLFLSCLETLYATMAAGETAHRPGAVLNAMLKKTLVTGKGGGK